MNRMLMVNIGCGDICHTDWINLDLRKRKNVQYYDIRRKLPFEENKVDVIYHSHLLEHLDKGEAVNFLAECFRVMKPGGIIRVVVPDMENICKEYLNNLESGFMSKDDKTIFKYQWNKLELFDQMIRQKSGGDMIKLIRSDAVDKDYVISRNGDEFVRLFDKNHFKNKLPYKFLKLIYDFLRRSPAKSGEAHKWMYDRLDLSLSLDMAGFDNPQVMDYKTSQIEGWPKYGLDTSSEGQGPRKPDSLFIEAVKKI